jgi:hypothetical protein
LSQDYSRLSTARPAVRHDCRYFGGVLTTAVEQRPMVADGYRGVLGAVPYAIRASESVLFRGYAAISGLLVLGLALLFGAAVVVLVADTAAAAGGSLTLCRLSAHCSRQRCSSLAATAVARPPGGRTPRSAPRGSVWSHRCTSRC